MFFGIGSVGPLYELLREYEDRDAITNDGPGIGALGFGMFMATSSGPLGLWIYSETGVRLTA